MDPVTIWYSQFAAMQDGPEDAPVVKSQSVWGGGW